MVAADDFRALADRPDWTVDEKGLRTRRVPTGWRAIVRVPAASGTLYSRYHVAVVDPDGIASYAQTASSISEARRVAEGHAREAVTVHSRQWRRATCLRDAGSKTSAAVSVVLR
jgi:hypothetical protein